MASGACAAMTAEDGHLTTSGAGGVLATTAAQAYSQMVSADGVGRGTAAGADGRRTGLVVCEGQEITRAEDGRPMVLGDCAALETTRAVVAGQMGLAALSATETRDMSIVGVIVALVLSLMIALAGASPALAEPPGQNTVAEWRWFLDEMERRYDARARRAVEVFHADGALAESYLWSDCLKSQTIEELRTWLRTEAPADLTVLEALQLNAKQHGCEPRDQADADADLASSFRPEHQPHFGQAPRENRRLESVTSGGRALLNA